MLRCFVSWLCFVVFGCVAIVLVSLLVLVLCCVCVGIGVVVGFVACLHALRGLCAALVMLCCVVSLLC